MNPNQKTDFVNDCDALLDLIPEYAFGLMDSEQARQVEASLLGCPEAAKQLEEFRYLQEELRAGVPQIEPPPLLGERLMAAVTATAAAPAPSPPAVAAPAVPAPAAVPTRTPPARRVLIRFAWAAAAAAVLALVATNLYWLNRVAELTQSHDMLAALVGRQQDAFVLTSTDNLHWVRLADPEDENSASAFMMWNNESKTGLLYARSFPELEPDHIYHLWLRKSGEDRVFAGVFSVDAEGNGALLFNSPEPIEDFAWAGVTAESPNDAPADPPAPVVGGRLDSA